MRLIELFVCFSIVNETANVTRQDWRKLACGDFQSASTRMIINTYDETALEYALRIKDAAKKSDITVNCTALTVSEGIEEAISRNLFAVGFDRVLMIYDKATGDYSPNHIPLILASFFRKESFDLIFFGQQNSLSCGGQSPSRLSAMLNIPFAGYVTDCFFEEGLLHSTCKTKGGFISAVTQPAGIFAFFNTEHPYLRIATLREKMAVKSKTPEMITLSDISGFENEVRLISVSYDPPTRECKMIEAENLDEQVEKLLSLLGLPKDGIA